jgi:hypothetical protein
MRESTAERKCFRHIKFSLECSCLLLDRHVCAFGTQPPARAGGPTQRLSRRSTPTLIVRDMGTPPPPTR